MRFFTALACVLLAAVQGRGQTPASTHELSLSVVTYNIRYDNPGDGDDRWEKRRDGVARLIRDHDPDVVSLQEALRNQLDDLGKALPAYGEIGVGRDDGKTKGEYAAILYRKVRFRVVDSGTFWFSDTPEIAGSKSWGNNCVRICTWARLKDETAGRMFQVYNVHLDHESENSRVKSVEMLSTRIMSRTYHDPFLVTGDFNAGESSQPVLGMKDSRLRIPSSTPPRMGLLDSFRIAHPSEADARTFNDFGHGHGTKDKIDYIFVTRGTTVTDAGIDRRSKDGHFPSDHFAVWSKLTLPVGIDPFNRPSSGPATPSPADPKDDDAHP